MGGPIPIALLFKGLPFPIDLAVILGLWPENEDEVGVAAEATPGEDSRDDGVGDLSSVGARDESRNFEGIFEWDSEGE